jgi:hypothetical protein
MPDPDIEEALIAFEASRTAVTPKGKLVMAKLREYQGRGDIGFSPLTPTRYGESFQHSFGKNVFVNDAYRGDVGATSLVLAHEGIHRISNTGSFDEEVSCFEFQIDYYNELLIGVSYTSPSTITKAVALTGPSTLGAPSETDKARQWRSNNQLVDFVLAKPAYIDKIGPSWVKANLGLWGGIRNRWATSKGVFVRALATNTDMGNGMLILDVLDSISQQSEWNEMQRVAGDFNKVRQTLRKYRDTPIAGRRMDELSKKWKIDWTVR